MIASVPASLPHSLLSIPSSSVSQPFVVHSVSSSNSDEELLSNLKDNPFLRKKLAVKLDQMIEFVKKQNSIAKQAKGSEGVAIGTGLWEFSWGIFESLFEGISRVGNLPVSIGLLASKLAYTCTSLEELLSAIYLWFNHSQYVDTLGDVEKSIANIRDKVNSNNFQFMTPEDFQIINYALNDDFAEVVKSDLNKEANYVIAGMQLFNAVVLSLMVAGAWKNKLAPKAFHFNKNEIKLNEKFDKPTREDIHEALEEIIELDNAEEIFDRLHTAIDAGKTISWADLGVTDKDSISKAKVALSEIYDEEFRLFNLPESWIPVVEDMQEKKEAFFDKLAKTLGFKHEKAGDFIEASTISVPMGVLAVYKFWLASQSVDEAFGNTLFAQAMSHVGCFIGGAAQGYHSLILRGYDTEAYKTFDFILNHLEPLLYFISFGKLFNFIYNGSKNDDENSFGSSKTSSFNMKMNGLTSV